MIVRLTNIDESHVCSLSEASKKFLDGLPIWDIKATLWQQRRPIINGWRIELVKRSGGVSDQVR